MQVKLDLIKDSGFIEELGKLSICRVCTVSAMKTSDANTSGFLVAASLASGIPQIGDFHPDAPLLSCVRKEVVPGERKFTAYIKCYYEALKNAAFDYVYEMGTALVSTESSYDHNDKLVKLRYTNKAVQRPGGPGPNGGSTVTTIPAEPAEKIIKFPIQRPVTTIRVTRTEKGPLNVPSKTIVGFVNSDNWAGGKPGTWLTYDVNAVSNSNGATYRVQYTVAYNPLGWRSQNYWTLIDGSIPDDVEPSQPFESLDGNYSGNGFFFVQPFKSFTFATLFGRP